ncbi:MAG: translation initiation factor IF-1A [Nanoarchaeota archaeon]
MADDYGDFEEVVDENISKISEEPLPEGMVRARMPKGKELIGVIVQRYGGNRMDVKASDGKSRNCRVPGRFKRSLWLRPKDIVLIVPWIDDNDKGDVVYKYNPGGVSQLRRKGMLNNLKVEF